MDLPEHIAVLTNSASLAAKECTALFHRLKDSHELRNALPNLITSVLETCGISHSLAVVFDNLDLLPWPHVQRWASDHYYLSHCAQVLDRIRIGARVSGFEANTYDDTSTPLAVHGNPDSAEPLTPKRVQLFLLSLSRLKGWLQIGCSSLDMYSLHSAVSQTESIKGTPQNGSFFPPHSPQSPGAIPSSGATAAPSLSSTLLHLKHLNHPSEKARNHPAYPQAPAEMPPPESPYSLPSASRVQAHAAYDEAAASPHRAALQAIHERHRTYKERAKKLKSDATKQLSEYDAEMVKMLKTLADDPNFSGTHVQLKLEGMNAQSKNLENRAADCRSRNLASFERDLASILDGIAAKDGHVLETIAKDAATNGANENAILDATSVNEPTAPPPTSITRKRPREVESPSLGGQPVSLCKKKSRPSSSGGDSVPTSELVSALGSRTVTFDEVYQGGKALNKHAIITHPSTRGIWFIVKCECDDHTVHFLGPRAALQGAAKHLDTAFHMIPRSYVGAIKHLGWQVLGCDEERAAANNAVFEKALREYNYVPVNTRNGAGRKSLGGARNSPAKIAAASSRPPARPVLKVRAQPAQKTPAIAQKPPVQSAQEPPASQPAQKPPANNTPAPVSPYPASNLPPRSLPSTNTPSQAEAGLAPISASDTAPRRFYLSEYKAPGASWSAADESKRLELEIDPVTQTARTARTGGGEAVELEINSMRVVQHQQLRDQPAPGKHTLLLSMQDLATEAVQEYRFVFDSGGGVPASRQARRFFSRVSGW